MHKQTKKIQWVLNTLKLDHVEAIIPVSTYVYKIDESKFSYNKDSDSFVIGEIIQVSPFSQYLKAIFNLGYSDRVPLI